MMQEILITHGKPANEIKDTSVNLAEQYEEEEDKIRLALQHFQFQQEKWRRGVYECLERQDRAITQLVIELDEIGHIVGQLKMHYRENS
jgi:sirohydrochlorin ferrochelatase